MHVNIPGTILLFLADESKTYQDLDDTSAWSSDMDGVFSMTSPSGSTSAVHATNKKSSHGQNDPNRSSSVIAVLVTTNESLVKQLDDQRNEIKDLKSIIDQQNEEIVGLKNEISATQLSKGPKRRMNKSVSDTIRMLYPTLEDNEKFNINMLYGCDFNRRITANLAKIVKESGDANDIEIQSALKSRFDNEKRKARDSDQAKYTVKLNSRRVSLYNSRQRASFKFKIGQDIFNTLTADDMSDQYSDDGSFVCKRPSWRTAEVTECLDQIDAKWFKKVNRTVGTPNKRQKRKSKA